MNLNQYDILFVGGGLVNSLLAWQLKRIKPWLRFLILEKGHTLGGKHTWSFHEQDVSPAALEWLKPLLSAVWPFYEVAFPKYHRIIESRYFSIRSRKLHEVITKELFENILFDQSVLRIEGEKVFLEDGRQLQGRVIVDGRGLHAWEPAALGFQKFLGLELELNHPHGLKGPVLMDATVIQQDGYRFLYCLPWTETRLLVEDTRYSRVPELDIEGTRQGILNYCLSKAWQVKEIFDEEQGCLPLPLSNHFIQGSRCPEEVRETPITVGMRGGFFHPTTGYSFPCAVETVELLMSAHEESDWQRLLEGQKKKLLETQSFYWWLNRVLFCSVADEKRFELLQHFYQLPDDVIHAFYSGQMGWLDKVRFFLRTPPVSVSAALRVWNWGTVNGNE